MSRARDLASLGDNTSKLEQQGLVQIVPSSITKGASGSASVDSKGNVTFSGTESVRFNSVFSSSYQNYFAVYQILMKYIDNSYNLVDIHRDNIKDIIAWNKCIYLFNTICTQNKKTLPYFEYKQLL